MTNNQFGDVATVRSEDADRRLAAVAELSLDAARNGDASALLMQAVRIVATTLDNEYAKVLELLPDGKALLLRAGVGWREGLVGSVTVDAGLDSQAGYTLLADRPVVVADLRTEPRFRGPPLLVEHGVVSGISTIIPGPTRAWGVLGTHTARPRRFGEDDVQFVQAVAALLGLALARARADEARVRAAAIVEASRDALIGLALDGTITSWNAGAERLYGYGPPETLGRSIAILLSPERADEVQALLNRIRRGERVDQPAARQVRQDGRLINVGVEMYPIRDEADRIVGEAMVGRDLAEQNRWEAERDQLLAREHAARIRAGAAEVLRKSEERFHGLVASVKDFAILLLDAQGRIVSWNAGAERIKGFREVEILGQHVAVFYPPEDVARGTPAEELLRAAAEGRVEVEGWHLRKDGSRFWANVIMTALHDPDGRLTGFVRVTRDLTERKQAEDALLAVQAALAVHLADFTHLYALADRLASTTSLKAAVDEVLAAVTTLQGTTSGVVMLEDRETGELYLLASVGVPEASLDRFRRIPRGTGVGGVAAAERRVVIVEDLAGELDTTPDRDALELGGYRAAFGVPLQAPRDEIIGAIATLFPEPHAPTERELRLVQLYAQLAAGFLANARLAQDAQDAVRDRDELSLHLRDDLRRRLKAIKERTQRLREGIGASTVAGDDAMSDDLATIEAQATRIVHDIEEFANFPHRRAAPPLALGLRTTDAEDVESILAERLRSARMGPEYVPGPRYPDATRTTRDHQAHSWPEDERARFLRTVSPFRSLPPDALRFAASLAQLRRVRAGEVVFLEGESLESLRVVVEGRITILRAAPGGREAIIRIAGRGEMVGIVAIGAKLTHRASAVAQVDTIYLVIPSDEFVKLLKTHSAFSRAIISTLGRRLYDAETRICILQTENAERRVAWTLLNVQDQLGSDHRTLGCDDLPLPRSELALLAGTNVSTVSRTLSTWGRQGIVDVGRKRVRVLDYSALREIAGR